LFLRLLSPAMVTDDATYRRRLGFWLRAARERAGKSQAGAAEFLGFSPKSKSTISDYENGVTVPSILVLRKLAAWYRVPIEVFTDPPPTPEERLDEIARAAVAEGRADWEAAAERGREVDAAPAATPRRRSA